ncbi:sterile alpha motif domain-containing protein 1-like [Phodopus roborovskii]|uniref:sterile alpha motif domain-containing protein 1-like n=1 Tax=Phodopus roborovskii TaxID=109678 RepID=UPI0021E44B96|nr:sterile alpha motif domain-containing protein 1-like [Phodopus roborovskii]
MVQGGRGHLDLSGELPLSRFLKQESSESSGGERRAATSKAPPRRSQGGPASRSPRVPRPPRGARLPAGRQREAGRERGARPSPEQPLSVTAAERQRGRACGPGGRVSRTRNAEPTAQQRRARRQAPPAGPGRPLASKPQAARVSDRYQGRAGRPRSLCLRAPKSGRPQQRA